MADPASIRSFMRQKRAEMSDAQRADASRQICDHLRRDPRIRQAQTLFAYAPLGTEVDIFPLLEGFLQEGKTVALPKVTGVGEMHFYKVEDLSALKIGTFSVREPDPAGGELLPEAADVLLIPGLAFSGNGDRIGYGGGYYDRYLPRCRGLRLMVAFDFQQADFAGQAHDVPMQAAATQQGIRDFPGEV